MNVIYGEVIRNHINVPRRCRVTALRKLEDAPIAACHAIDILSRQITGKSHRLMDED